MFSRRTHGFTLIELMVAVAVLAILAALAFPSFQYSLRNNRVAALNNEVIGLVNLARSEAIRSGSGGGVCGSSAGTSCDGNWAGGMLAFADADGDGEMGGDDTALRFASVGAQLQVTAPDDPIVFDGRGRRRAAADQELVVRPTECTEGAEQQRSLTINASGQIRSIRETCA